MMVSPALAAVTTGVSGRPLASQPRWSLLPGLPRSTGLRPPGPPRLARPLMVSPLACGHATRPPPPAVRGGAAAELAGRQQPPAGRGAGHVHDRREAVAIRDGTMPTAMRGRGGAGSKGFTRAHSCTGTGPSA